MRIWGSLGCSVCEVVELRILCGGSRAISRTITILDFWKANFGLFKDLLRGIPWVRDLEGGGGPREIVTIQASLPLYSSSVNPHEYEIKQKRQETCMDQQGASSKTQMEEEGLQKVERGTDHLGGI